MFSRPLENKVLPLAPYIQIYKGGDFVDIKGMGAVQTKNATEVLPWKTGRTNGVTMLRALGTQAREG